MVSEKARLEAALATANTQHDDAEVAVTALEGEVAGLQSRCEATEELACLFFAFAIHPRIYRAKSPTRGSNVKLYNQVRGRREAP